MRVEAKESTMRDESAAFDAICDFFSLPRDYDCRDGADVGIDGKCADIIAAKFNCVIAGFRVYDDDWVSQQPPGFSGCEINSRARNHPQSEPVGPGPGIVVCNRPDLSTSKKRVRYRQMLQRAEAFEPASSR